MGPVRLADKSIFATVPDRAGVAIAGPGGAVAIVGAGGRGRSGFALVVNDIYAAIVCID